MKRLDFYDKGVVSPLYICFSVNTDKACSDFYTQYFEYGMMNRQIKAIAQEGARNHGLLNISIGDLFGCLITCPPLSEQKKIAEILRTADKEIELLQKDLEQQKLIKKSLMQLLLTGIVRVNNER